MRKDTPMFASYGKNDDQVPIEVAQKTLAYFKDNIYKGSENFKWYVDTRATHHFT